jgi:hypothetical protein
MTAYTGLNPTLIEVAKRMEPGGRIQTIAELLSQTNEILADAPFLEGNLPTGHRVTVRTGLPEVAWRKLNRGVLPSRSTTAQIDEAVGMLEAFGQVDVDLAKLNGNTAEFRLSENYAFLEAMNQTMASTMFYGDTAINPERFLGLSPRFSSRAAAVQNSTNVLHGGGAGSTNTSVWLIGWGPNTVFCTYPKGSQAGLIHEDLGIETVSDAEGGQFRAFRDRYQWKCGLVVRDWRYVIRIANVDTAQLNAAASGSSAKLTSLMTRALEQIHGLEGVTPVFYCNRTVRSWLRQQQIEGVRNSTLAYDMQGGKRVLSFAEVPVRRVDAILNTEGTVPA